MAEKRKFAALANLNQAAAEPEAPTPRAEARLPMATPIPPERGRGRPPGKRSDPEWKLYSHYLRKKTQKAAVAKLQAEDDPRDLSDILDELLDTWAKS